MGGSMSIENATNVDLDMSLDQLGPLYYENHVKPGQVFYRQTGKSPHPSPSVSAFRGAVHFTVVASYAKEGVEKNDDWSVAKPILIAVGTGIIAAGTAGAALPAAALGLGAGSALIGTGAIVATVADVTLGASAIALAPKVVECLIDQFGEQQALSSPGWYAGKHHRLRVTGGVERIVNPIGGGKSEVSWKLKPLVLEYR